MKAWSVSLIFAAALAAFWAPRARAGSGFAEACESSDPEVAAVVAQLKSQVGESDCAAAAPKIEASTELSLFGVATVEPLRGLTRLAVLHVSGSQLTDLDAIATLSGLSELFLFQALAAEASSDVLAPLSGLGSLRHLELGRNGLRDLTALAALTGLEELNLEANQISDLRPLAGLTSLRHLSIHANQIVDLGPLAGLTNLTELRFDRNQVADLAPLAGLTRIEFLQFLENSVSDLSPLREMKDLRWLRARNNQIKSLASLSGMQRLRHIVLNDNAIDAVELKDVPSLLVLVLANNPIGTTVAKTTANCPYGDGVEAPIQAFCKP